MKTPRGRCLCGKVRFSFDSGAMRGAMICQCETCRRATAAPMVGIFTLPDSAWRWVGATPAVFESSPGVTRGFCGTCGTPMFHRSSNHPGVTRFYAATLIDPGEFTPTASRFCGERLDWALRVEDLPKAD